PDNVLLPHKFQPTRTNPQPENASWNLGVGSWDFSPKVSDFGLAKVLDAGSSRTRSGAILGTPAYMAPEQARGGAVGPAADVYALGAVLYECLTGRPPFEGGAGWDVILQVLNSDPGPPSRWRPRLARDLDTVCLTALAKDPAERYPSAAALADDLDRFVAGEAITARPEPRWRKVGRAVRRRPLTAAAVVVLAATAALVAG